MSWRVTPLTNAGWAVRPARIVAIVSRSSASISRVVKARLGVPGGCGTPHEFVGGHAVRKLGANRGGGHLAHRSSQGVTQERALVHHGLAFKVPRLGKGDRFLRGHAQSHQVRPRAHAICAARTTAVG